MSRRREIVFLDVGGPIYDDVWYARALLGALRELGAEVTEEDFWREYDGCRRAQAGIRRALAARFLGAGADVVELSARARRRWRYPPEALYADVRPALERLASRYRLGVLANQPDTTRSALERDGIALLFDVWVISDEIGREKPDPRIFAHALSVAGCEAGEATYVGNRLDIDIRPAKSAGLRSVWILRGEAPPEPTAEQLAEPDAVIRSLAELPDALERLAVAR
ncbi:HAD-SF-IA-v1: HAD hydrolase, family IA, variant 1 [Gaiella occulta]|uniref:HAD-SF-IA-v1: HAD hydrolase, family IA, variant 1 n=1 Tax=Gaiella occulta TaxID=1002870 RepID=A0A7M2Z0I3_9ACTN|nr:HAD family hydrolase [Gaiella occulta]RDI75817.1 HAD-SF-IA-v1: HAD hydrolase, family IA, variant 1 [Gaiella occulta]